MRVALFAVATLLAAGCGGAALQPPACEGTQCGTVAHTATGSTLAMAGVPHTAAIDTVALSPDGRAALTRDRRGGARLWTALDGSAEPVTLPAPAIDQMSVDASGDAIAITVVDAAGAMQIMTYDGREFEHHASLPPHAGVKRAYVTSHGRRIIALGTDHSVRLYTLTGDELDRWQPRDASTTDLFVSSSPARAIAVSRAEATATRLAVSANLARLKPLGEAAHLDLPDDDTRDAVQFAVSPDGDLLAYVAGGDDEAYAMLLYHFDTGVAVDTFVPISTHAVPTIGFIGPREILTGDRTARSLWRFDVSSSELDAREIEAAPHEAVVPAYGTGLRIGARSSWLMVHSVDADDTRYLGYDELAPHRAAIAPGNGYVAWAAERSVFIEPLSGEDGRVHLDQTRSLDGTITGLFFYDDEHLIEVGTAGQLLLVRWRTGEVIDAVITRTLHTVARFDRDTDTIRIQTPDGELAFGVDRALGFVAPVADPRDPVAEPGLPLDAHVPVVRRVSSPDARATAVVRADGFVDVYAGRTRLWTYATGDAPAREVAWAPDGSTLAVAAATGSAVLTARDGRIVYKRCATHFQVRAVVMGGSDADGVPSICE